MLLIVVNRNCMYKQPMQWKMAIFETQAEI